MLSPDNKKFRKQLSEQLSRTWFRRAFSACLLLAGTGYLPSLLAGEWAVGVGIEYFHWKEDIINGLDVTETGQILTASLRYLQTRDAGLVLGYRGKLWGGRVKYEGSELHNPDIPLSGKSGYAGISNEAQVRWRSAGDHNRLDGVFGMGFDYWRRSLTVIQDEDWYVGYLRLGMESGMDDPGNWSAALGVKYPVWTRENAHLNKIGFDTNPVLEPGYQISVYADLAYRLATDTQLVLYYDGFRFPSSEEKPINDLSTGIPISGTVGQPSSTMSIIGIKLEHLIQ
ncbi:MAG: hypothetical protein ABL878_15290 [Burkholderiales bacterium]